MQLKISISQPVVDILAREEKARYTVEEEEKRIELLIILTVRVNKYTNKGKEFNYNTIIEEMKNYKEIKFSVLKDILKFFSNRHW